MEKYYTFFDVSGYQDGLINTLVVGMGPKKPDVQVLKEHYDYSFATYRNHTGDVSSWTYEPNPWQFLPNDTNKNGTDTNGGFDGFIKKNTTLFVVCCVILGFLIVTLVCLCIYLKRKSNKNRMGHIFKDKMTYYGKTENTKIQQQMDLSISLDQGD